MAKVLKVDLINRNDLLAEVDKVYNNHYSNACDKTIHDIFNAIRKRIRAAADGITHGYWTYYSVTMMECSVCKRHTARHRFEYCPHCGAVMDGRSNVLR